MKHTARLITLTLFAAFLLSTAPRAADLYSPKPSDVPDWAKQGMFHFIRIDGGDIETMKALRTHWGKEFTPDEQQSLTTVYSSGQDKLFSLLKQAGFNWIWVTWSNGWSNPDEKETQRQLRSLIKRAHADGIHVTTYLSATNMFWESMFRDESESITWVRLDAGRPVLYGGPMNPMRFIADPANPDWRKYIIKKALAAVSAGADAVFFDNVIGDKDALKILFSEFQQAASRVAQKSGNPKAPLYVNAHLEPERLDINDTCEIIWNEYAKGSPGVWDGKWDLTSARKTRFILGAKYPWQPHKYEYDTYRCGPRERCFPDPETQKLSIAEAWAFGSSLSRNIEGRFLDALLRDQPDAVAAWNAIASYNLWITAHRDLYTDAAPVATIAVLSQKDGRSYAPREHNFAELMIKRSIPYAMKVIRRLDRGIPLKNFRLLVVPEPFDTLTPAEESLLNDWVRNGGAVYAAPPSDKGYKPPFPFKPIPPDALAKVDKNEPPDDFFSDLLRASSGPSVIISGSPYVVASLMQTASVDRFFIHLLNYNMAPAANVTVTLNLSPLLSDLRPWRAQLLSPDDPSLKPASLSLKSSTLTLSLKQLDRYAVLELSKGK